MLTRNTASEYGEYSIGPVILRHLILLRLRNIEQYGEGHSFDKFIISKIPITGWGTLENLEGLAVFLHSMCRILLMVTFCMWMAVFWHISESNLKKKTTYIEIIVL